jgi:hypothetical protein
LFPFDGKRREEVCQGLCYAKGLYLQCSKVKVEESEYCKKCLNESKESEFKKPKNGTIEDRLNQPYLEYVTPKGIKVLPYVKVMKKMKASREEIEEEAGTFGIEIDKIHFEEEVKKPRKAKKNSKKGVKKEEDLKSPKQRGRPKKENKKVEKNETDIFADLVLNTDDEESDVDTIILDTEGEASDDNTSSIEEEVVEEEEVEEEEEEIEEKVVEKVKEVKEVEEVEEVKEVEELEEVEEVKEKSKETKKKEETGVTVKKFKYKNIEYLRDNNTNIVYDKKTQNPIGIWKKKEKEIEFQEFDEEEEEEEEEEEY